MADYFNLRYYQSDLCESARKAWEVHQSTAIIAATAAGKTQVYLSLAVEQPGRVLVLAHRDYLLEQPIRRLAEIGFDDVAVEKAERRAETGYHKAKIVFASIQSVGPVARADRLATFAPTDFSLVVIDEGHRTTADSYRRVLDHFRANPAIKILVVTATPKRKDGVALGNVCESVAGVYGPAQAMAEGWIPPVRFFRRDVQSLDFSHVRLKGTDLDPEQAQALLMQEKPLHEICSSLAEDHGPTVVFCPEVAVARLYAELMNARYRRGRAAMLCAESGDEERAGVIKKLAAGELDYLMNVDIATEGLDIPNLQRVVWACPTASLVRYTQGCGRVFRPHDSLRGLLCGGPEMAPQRRALIEQSPKPYGMVVTYYPRNCKHELCDPVDVLGGDELPDDVKFFAKQTQEETSKQGGGSSTEEDIETAKVFCDLRAVLDQRRRELKAKAKYADRQFDPMSGRKQTGGHADTKAVRQVADNSWPDGEPATDKQRNWFRWKGVKADVVMMLTKWRAAVVRDLFELGVALETALSYGKRQALAVRDEVRARQGRQS